MSLLRHQSSVSFTRLQPPPAQKPLDLVNLGPLMQITSGRAETRIALIDGPVATGHPELSSANIIEVPNKMIGSCKLASSAACRHGTFVAGILAARRGSDAPAICPGCTLLVRPIFPETTARNSPVPSAAPEDLATAIIECVNAGAHVINLSAAIQDPSLSGERRLNEALNYSAQSGVIVVAAAGNQGSVGSSVITRHAWVIPVTASDLMGRSLGYSNLGNSIGRRGLSAPGTGIISLDVNGQTSSFVGTSAAAPFVTGAIALLLSVFPKAKATVVKQVITAPTGTRRSTVVPPLMNASAAYTAMAANYARK